MKKILLCVGISVLIGNMGGLYVFAQTAQTTTAPISTSVSKPMPIAVPTSTSATSRGIGSEVKKEVQEMNTQAQQIRQEVRTEVQQKRDILQKEAQQKREEFRTEVQTMRASTTTIASSTLDALRQKKMNMEKELQQKREALRVDVKQAHDQVKDKITAARNELQNKLKNIKDERKKETVLSIQDNLAKINEKITSQLLANSERMQTAMYAINTRADALETTGVNVSGIRSTIESIQSEMQTAQQAIKTQAAKVYTVAVTNDSLLKQDTMTARQLLMDDLASLRNLVQRIHTTLQDVAHALVLLQKTIPVTTTTQ